MNQTALKQLIETFYEAESDMTVQETQLVKFSLQASIEDTAMLNALCERFNVSRYSLSKEIVHNAVAEMFSALSDEDKAKLAAKADAETTEHLKKVGYTMFNSYGAAGEFENESAHWRHRLALPKQYGGEAE